MVAGGADGGATRSIERKEKLDRDVRGSCVNGETGISRLDCVEVAI